MRSESESEYDQPEAEEMCFDMDFDTDGEYEIIKLNPNTVYDSDSCMDEELEKNEIKISEVIAEPPEVLRKVEADSCQQHDQAMQAVDLEITKMEETSCDSIEATHMSNESQQEFTQKKVKKKLNLQEYKIRRANDPVEPLFDLPKKLPVFELCENGPSSLPIIVLPTDPRPAGLEKIHTIMNGNLKDSKDVQVDYEEIVLVSAACNTEMSIVPDEADDGTEKKPGNKYLKNIVNNLKKDNVEMLLNSSTSLFSSIQAVIHEQRIDKKPVANGQLIGTEHGEDKVIMHLRKDRIRAQKCNAANQTDSSSMFPPLLLSPSLIFNRIRNARTYRKRSRSRSHSTSPTSIDYDRYNKYSNQKRCSRSQHSTHSSSMSSSDSGNSDSDSDSSTSSHYSSSTSSSKRSGTKYHQTYEFYRRNQRSQNYPMEDQRRIVYVGGLEEQTTKDEIRRKFLVYGTIKKISIHTKEENGVRYGFVTFERPEDAYDAIEKYSKDPQICKYDVRFGGRRRFCRQTYADLDSLPEADIVDSSCSNNSKNLSFEALLELAKKNITGGKK